MKVCQFACSPRCLARARVFVKKVDHGCGCGMCGCGEKQQSEAYHVILVTCGHCNHVHSKSCEIFARGHRTPLHGPPNATPSIIFGSL